MEISKENYDMFVKLLQNNSKSEVAKMLNVSRPTIYKWINELGIKEDHIKKEAKLEILLNDLKKQNL
jgi:DNA invertase Pin-like site-specific DNA recombinase